VDHVLENQFLEIDMFIICSIFGSFLPISGSR